MSLVHILEPGTEPKAPALLLLHGTGGTERDLVGLGRRVAPGATLLSPRGPVSEHGAARFFPRKAEGVFDPGEVAAHTAVLADWTRSMRAASACLAGPLFALGFSNGANAAAVLLQRHPGLLAGAVLLRAMVVIDEPAAPGSLAGVPVLLLNGVSDPIVPVDHPDRLAAHLRSGGATVETVMHPHAGHGLVPEDLMHAARFLRESMARPAKPKPGLAEYLLSEAGGVLPEVELEPGRDRRLKARETPPTSPQQSRW
jgi:phospholipase/carboxylesterase